jgi:hypothetical protein
MQRPVVGTGNRILIVRVPCSHMSYANLSLKRRAVGKTMRRDAWWTNVVLVDEVNRAHTPRP